MNQPQSDDGADGTGADGTGAERAEQPADRLELACPFFKRYPIRHSKCIRYTLTRTSDVAQHLRRRHNEEAKKVKNRGRRGATVEERWYIIWDALFPGQPRPAVPYINREAVGALITRHGGEMLAQDFVGGGALDTQAGHVSGQRVSDITVYQPQRS
jgi:hypothetical protein